MSVRKILLASVSAAFLAASAAVSGPAAAAPPNINAQLAAEAYKALSAGDPTTAVQSYSTAIESRELEPEVLANALLNRGLAYQYLNQHDLAIGDYTAAMRIDAMSGKLRAMALYNRGLSYQKLGQDGLAMEDYTSALFLDAAFAHAYYSRATLLRAGGQYLFALSDYEKAVQHGYPDLARVYYGEALTYLGLQRPDDARTVLKLAIAANPEFQPAQQRLALLDGSSVGTEAADQITTASIASAGGSQPANGQELPTATAPSAELLGSAATAEASVQTAGNTSVKKTITERVPGQEAEAAEETIVAIEPVSDAPAGETATAETPAPAVQPAGWSVQVASASSEDAAWSTWKKMQAKHRVLANKNPVVIRADLGTKGTFYRVRLTGFDKQDDAKSACSKLQSSGVKCFISKASS